jgi:tRNA nucleotidyltransferase (CCA-adding enzyme)
MNQVDSAGFAPHVPPGADRIRRILCDEGYRAVFVGGCVRDTLLGLPAADWDIGTSARPEDCMRIFLHHGIEVIPTGLRHGTVTVLWDGAGYEVTTFREDAGYSDGRRPDAVLFTDSLEQDLARRDFTINAIAWDPASGLIDPFDGQADLKSGRIRTVGDPSLRFSEDALRMMRAVRFVGRLGFSIDSATFAAIRAHANTLVRVSAERISSEWVQTAASPHPEALFLYHETGLLSWFLPELEALYALSTGSGQSIGEHCIRVALLTPPTMVLRIAGLLHDIARTPDPGPGPDLHAALSAESADRILRRLRFSVRDRERIVWLIATHDDPVPATPADARRLLAAAGPDRWEDWFALVAADWMANHPNAPKSGLAGLERAAGWVRNSIESGDPIGIQHLAVDGTDVVRAGFEGRAVGRVLHKCLDLVLENPSANSRENLMRAMKSMSEEDHHD